MAMSSMLHFEGSERCHIVRVEQSVRDGMETLFTDETNTHEAMGWGMVLDAARKDEVDCWKLIRAKYRAGVVELRQSNAQVLISMRASQDVKMQSLGEEELRLGDAVLASRRKLGGVLEGGMTRMQTESGDEAVRIEQTKRHLQECIQDSKQRVR